jgi:hypothetical protein
MFLELANLFGTDPDKQNLVFLVSSDQLSRWLDEVWSSGGRIPSILSKMDAPFLGDTAAVLNQQLPQGLLNALPSGIDVTNTENFTNKAGPTSTGTAPTTLPLIWDHLIYAYLIESTGVFEIFAEVVRRLLVGETLATLDPAANQWLRATEDLLFKDPPPFGIDSVMSELRPRGRVNRRNLYYRWFGMELPHQIPGRWGSSSDTSWKSDVGPGVNTDFRDKWSELLRQVWLGIENKNNGIGPKPTDPTYLALLCLALRDMLINRRLGGRGAREEFNHVKTMAWLHLTVNTNSPIVRSLQAFANSPADRLAAIGQRVGMKPAARSRELFELAQPMSRVLRAIELDMFSDATGAAQLFNDPTLSNEMTNVIDNWQSATGERVKERPIGTTASGTPAQPLRVPNLAHTNGARV